MSKAFTLVEGIVQFGIGVTDFLGGNKEFEAFTQAVTVTMLLGQGGHHHGVTCDESGGDAVDFEVFTDQLVQHAGVGARC